METQNINLKVLWNDDMQSITLTNSKGDTYTSRSEDLKDFLHDAALQAQSLPEEPKGEKSLQECKVIEQTKKEFTHEGIMFAVSEDQEAVRKASESLGVVTKDPVLQGRQHGFYAGMEHASKFTDALIQEINSLRYQLYASQQLLQPEGKTLEEKIKDKAETYAFSGVDSDHVAELNLIQGYIAGATEYANHEWISVKDRCPESLKDGDDVLVIYTDRSIGTCPAYLVSHLDHEYWMSLPTPPQK